MHTIHSQIFAVPAPAARSLRSFCRTGLLVLTLATAGIAGTSGFAANRVVKIAAPETAAPGVELKVPVTVSTDAGAGEQIGFFHADVSTDGGKTWTGFCYAQDVGARSAQVATFVPGPAGSECIIRVRVAFRGGEAGDVDFEGKKIDWSGSWENWKSPPAKYAIIPVVAP
ncbi:MAG: hypothetical protein HY302_15220 [Opitutae bacterium]|nr:hypothetical protein [Opitutae bacterium]